MVARSACNALFSSTRLLTVAVVVDLDDSLLIRDDDDEILLLDVRFDEATAVSWTYRRGLDALDDLCCCLVEALVIFLSLGPPLSSCMLLDLTGATRRLEDDSCGMLLLCLLLLLLLFDDDNDLLPSLPLSIDGPLCGAIDDVVDNNCIDDILSRSWFVIARQAWATLHML